MRLPALLLLASGLCYACDGDEESVQVKRHYADIIFRGTIVELRDASKPAPLFGYDTKKTVVFRVSRVWKGQVGQTFEMPGVTETSDCTGFSPELLKVGEDLLVYASRLATSEYLTSICGNHKPAKYAEQDFKALGRGKEPQRPNPTSRRP